MKTILTAAWMLLVSMPAMAGDGGCAGTTQECLDYMATKMKESGWVGVELDFQEQAGGPMIVTKVVEGSPAEEAGIRNGDVLVAMNGIVLAEENGEKLEAERQTWKAGGSIRWTMKRDDVEHDLSITLAPMPADALAYYIGQHMLEHATIAVADSEEPASEN